MRIVFLQCGVIDVLDGECAGRSRSARPRSCLSNLRSLAMVCLIHEDDDRLAGVDVWIGEVILLFPFIIDSDG